MLQARVLIADDDPVFRMDLRSMLESLGHTLAGEADNGEDVIRLARSLRPDLTILDIEMPRKSGLEAARVLAEERISPVLLLTAYSESRMIEEAIRSGVLAYLVKPFRGPELQPAIEVAIARYRELTALESERDALQEQIETRKVLSKARAILMARHEITDREAQRRIQAQSLALNKSLREIAEAIILSDEIAPQ
jgi:response regulator NasT